MNSQTLRKVLDAILVPLLAVLSGLVVMGTQGLHGIGRLLLGSVAEAFLRRADVPVLVVRSPRDLDGIPSGL